MGYILWENRNLVCIATGFDSSPSTNRKTGAMIQTYILRRDIDPVSASREATDDVTCGDCKHRHSLGGSCYVTLMHGPLSVYRAYRKGTYAKLPSYDVFNGYRVRIGTYGDPAFVPLRIWQAIVRHCDGYTGYTHQWRMLSKRSTAWRRILVASTDNDGDTADARRIGWRQFRIVGAGQDKPSGMVLCPASEEAGKRTTCHDCLLCNGSHGASVRDVYIAPHGNRRRRFVV